MKELIKQNYEITVRRGLINKNTTTQDFIDKIDEEFGELIDYFQYSGGQINRFELADIIMVCLNIAHHYQIDIIETIKQKIEINKNR